jgi:hypothetical protein
MMVEYNPALIPLRLNRGGKTMQRKTTVTAFIRRHRRNPARVFAGVLILAGFFLAGCNNPLNSPDTPVAEGGLVRIVVGGDDGGNARTIQPAASALAGYRLTFSNDGHDPVNIELGNSINVYLPDGTYTITATAYKSGGQVGNDGDAVASGSISITLVGGTVFSNGGIVPPIILGPQEGSGNGSFHYAVTIGAGGAVGTLKLWNINGTSLISEFDGDGMIEINASVENTETLAAGRYIAEIKLTDGAGKIAFLREVTEIWPGFTTDLVFAPSVYLDPYLIPVNSGAALPAASVIGGVAIGTGTGTGDSESSAVRYTLAAQNIANAPQNFVLGNKSLGAVLSWTATAGNVPEGSGYSDSPITDFSTNNVLWVRVVSEDTSTTRYYRFILYPAPPGNGAFTDTDMEFNEIGGNITWAASAHSGGVSGYRIYFGSASGDKLGEAQFTVSNYATSYTIPADTQLPAGAKYFLVYPYKSDENDYPLSLSIPIQDITFNGSYGDFTVKGIGNSNPVFVSWSDPVLTISGSGEYYITQVNPGSALAKQIVVQSDAGIILENVNLDVSAADDAVAFDVSGASVSLTLLGTNTLKSGKNKAGLQVPAGSSLTITANSSGSLEAVGGDEGAGIGGGSGAGGGSFSIKGGTITATGGQYAAGIGGGRNGGAGSIGEISKAVIVASSIQPSLSYSSKQNAIVMNGNNGNMYGNATLGYNLTIPAGAVLVIPEETMLTIPAGLTLTNNGRISLGNGALIRGTLTGNPVEEPALTITGGSSYTYQNRVLTITGNGIYTIGMGDGITQADLDRIVVNYGVTADITLNGVKIDASGIGACAFDMEGATVNLTLKGSNMLKSGGYEAGLEAPRGSTLTIIGGSADSLEAVAGEWSAGIGSSGRYSDGGNIIIKGGAITVAGGSYSTGIGGGALGGEAGTLDISGNAMLFALSIRPVLTAGENVDQAMVFIGDTGTVYGNATLQQDLTIPNAHTLDIPAFSALTIPGGVTLTNDGTILVYHGGVINGTVAGTQPVDSDLTISGGSSYTYYGGLLTITGNGTYAIAMSSGVSVTTTDRIAVAPGVNAAITLNDVKIDMSGSNATAFDMTGATV